MSYANNATHIGIIIIVIIEKQRINYLKKI